MNGGWWSNKIVELKRSSTAVCIIAGENGRRISRNPSRKKYRRRKTRVSLWLLLYVSTDYFYAQCSWPLGGSYGQPKSTTVYTQSQS